MADQSRLVKAGGGAAFWRGASLMVVGARSINEQRLTQLLRRGVDSEVLRARLAWSDAESIARYVRPLVGTESCHPNVLPTAQVSGRWSTTDPPIITWPAHDPVRCPECLARASGSAGSPSGWCPRDVRKIVEPWPGTWWAHGDADAVEARLAAAYTRDRDDLEAFAKGWDLHVTTMCGMFQLPLPSERTKAGIAADLAWQVAVGWGGPADRRRHAAKSFRYAWQYALDRKGVLQVKDLHMLGLTRDEILTYADAYAQAKTQFFAARRLRMDAALARGESRTFLGRRRPLYGDERERRKAAWSHEVQGAVSDITNITLRAILDGARGAWGLEPDFILNGYDSLTLAFPDRVPFADASARLGQWSTMTWDVEGTPVEIPFSWEAVTR